MKTDLQNLPSSPQLLQEIIHDLHQTIDQKNQELKSLAQEMETLLGYKQKYARLIEELRMEKQRAYSSSSEKNVLQVDMFDEPGAELSCEVKAQLDETVEVESHTRKRHPIRRFLPKELTREVIVHDIAASEKLCSCGSELATIGEEVTEQLKYIPAQLSVIRHVRPKYACKPCEGNVKIAPMPLLLLPKSQAAPELVAHTIVAKYCDHLPLYRQEAMWNRLDIDLPRSSLCGWLLKVADLCEPLVRLLQKNIVDYDYTQADETTVQVLNETGRANTTQSYMWCFRGGGDTQPSIVYEYQETRGGYHAKNFLTGFKGFLQTDAYPGYNWAHDKKGITPVGCHAHARRPFAKLAKIAKTPGLAHEALKFYRQLYAIEKEAKENNLSPQARYELRKQKSEPILKLFKEWLDLHLTKTSEQGKIGQAIRYCLKNWEELNQYLKDGRIQIDNNLVENAIRPFALGRKNWMFAGSPVGARAGAIFYSLIETCKANSIEPYQYFCSVLNRIRFCQSEDDYRKLLPQLIKF